MYFIFNWLPKSLLLRFILIIILPSIICQFTSVYVFYHRHWNNVVSNTSRLISNNIAAVMRVIDFGNSFLASEIANQLNIKYFDINKDSFANVINDISTHEFKILYDILITKFNQIKIIENKQDLDIFIKQYDKVLKFNIAAKPLINSTSYIFVIWLIMLNLFFVIISLLFARNQIRSILALTAVANNFGKGVKDDNFKPSGALEIKHAGFAFIKMRQRIEHQINKHTKMLAMISHDLCTPLTRLKLQLELLADQDCIQSMKEDINSMQQMINSYLDFAKGELIQEWAKIDFTDFVVDFFAKNTLTNLHVIFSRLEYQLYAKLDVKNFARVLSNILSNSAKYASKIKISSYFNDGMINLDIEDDGPGVVDTEKKLIMKPFYRIDQARHLHKQGNVGLGLAIAKEIIDEHGGVIKVLDSKSLKGLMIKILLKPYSD